MSFFKGRVRVRVCGLLYWKNKLLLLKHKNLGKKGYIWIPPGGGVNFGEQFEYRLKQEFLEETNLKIKVNEYLFANEYIGRELHAIEFFFRVTYISGTLKLGIDPEIPSNKQILSEARFFDDTEISKIPQEVIHNSFNELKNEQNILTLRGLIKCIED